MRIAVAALAAVAMLSWAAPLPAFGTHDALSPQQLAGQRVIYSYRGLNPPATLLRKIRAGEAAGVIFFGENISSRRQIRGVIDKLQRAAAQSPVEAPLLMMTDQEGGQVRRLPGAPVLSEKQIGASSDPASAARQAGRGAGRNLKGVGMNVNLAPVLDVYRTPGNFIDEFGRSYSMRPRTVARLGGAFIRTQQRTGVAATAKHFPGRGAAARSQNTDERPVTLRLSLGALRAVDEPPYASAISSEVRLVMVSWARYPALDKHRPAGLSSAVVHGELRKRLGFTGVTITDALEAGALRAYGPVSNRAVLAAGAGMDLVLCSSRSASQGKSAVTALAQALQQGRLDRSAFVASVKRVDALRSALAQ
jgi:beta-N-acetylhexosaminidase